MRCAEGVCMANKYSKLLFDASYLFDWINQWCELNLEDSFSITHRETDQRISYIITNDKEEIKIDFIKANGGALTIYPNVGKNQEISNLIAEDVYSRVTSNLTKSPFANGFSMKMAYDDFNILIELLRDYDNVSLETYSKQDIPGRPIYELYRFKSTLNDLVVIKYYNNTKRIQIQGKPLYLFNEILSLICQSEENANSVVDAHIEICNLSVDRDELNEELLGILGSEVYNFMTVSHRALLNDSIVLSKIRIDGLDDYSYIIQQALRAYEGFTLKMIKGKGCALPPRKQIGEFFTRQSVNDSFVMKQKYIMSLTASEITLFESMYSFFNSKRHPYMHSSDSDLTTTVIGTYDNALEKLEEIIQNMKVSYSKYIS